MKFVLLISFLLTAIFSFGQTRPNNGVVASTPQYYALKNARIVVSPDKTIARGTILIKDDKIEKIGTVVSIPNGAVEFNMQGKTILPAFIELNTSIGLPELKESESDEDPQLTSSKKGSFYWNESIHPEVKATALFDAEISKNDTLVLCGFGFGMTHQSDGIAQGEGAFVSLGSAEQPMLKATQSTSFFSFEKGVSNQTYPSSQMGSIALLRQALYDASWYLENGNERNLSLEALNNQLKGQMIFKTTDKWEILRAEKIAEEFGFQFSYFGSGNEYEIVDELSQNNNTIIVPLNFPEAYDVKNPYVARQIPLSDLKHWEMAPSNPAILKRKGIPICLSSKGVDDIETFWTNLRLTLKHGLTESEAIAALTTTPARLIGQEKLVGTLEPGKLASFIVYDINPFKDTAQVLESWLLGKRTLIKELPKHDITGKYNIQLDGDKFPLTITESDDELEAEVRYSFANPKGIKTDKKVDAHIAFNDNDVTIQFIAHTNTLDGNISLQGKVNTTFGVFEGDGMLPDGRWVKWSAIKKGFVANKKDKPEKIIVDTTNHAWLPNMAYGFTSLPESESIIIKNATLWTNEDNGIIEKGSIVIKDGKITYVGTENRSASGAKVIDGTGLHVTSGIIDEHSHIAISKGVNESGQAISAEVSIADVVNPDDINIYRQLSGGVTAAQLLHGSANPIGGQSALIKLKWGHSAEEMLIDNAPKFIKFALGENVKQANWGDEYDVRFPQTRMGVEQVFFDGFFRARDYKKEWKNYENDNSLAKPRKDLELEVLNEILDQERFVTCHSYVQSEINMLMHVADSMDFYINTFTHILEGYKLADKMVKHGAGGSTFSDWWAYKYEVNDAIPYNAAMMHKQGVVVAINSDDAEMGRRLNQEAAKSVKYGGMSEEDAWKMVTLNPAKLLHLDDRMGSLKEGKDADIVIWSDNPLSIQAKVNYTIVDGTVLFDAEKDLELRSLNQAEKARIITKMLDKNAKGGKTRKFVKQNKGHFHCNTLGEKASTEVNHH